MSAHTKEPWCYGSFGNLLVAPMRNGVPQKHDAICDIGPQHFPSDTEDYANARRIVACVNACEGMTNEDLENIAKQGDTLETRLQLHVETELELIDQKAEMLDALRMAVVALAGVNSVFNDCVKKEYDVVSRAIAKATWSAA